jgi:hypothetical protein
MKQIADSCVHARLQWRSTAIKTAPSVFFAPWQGLHRPHRLEQSAHSLALQADVRPSCAASCLGRVSPSHRECRDPTRALGSVGHKGGGGLAYGAGDAAKQAMRGVALLTALTFAAEIGDVRRFDNPRQLMAYLGLTPSESSTGERVRRGVITKPVNNRARRVLIEGASTYRFPARKSRLLQERATGLPRIVREIDWKAQVRL